MSGSQRSAVNQRLYFTSLHLQWMERETAAQQLSRSVIEQALGESVLLHLVMAYRAYLMELAEAYQLTGGAPQTAVELANLFLERGISSAECQELVHLERCDSWLSLLISSFENIGNECETAPAASSSIGIPLQTIDSQLPNLEQLKGSYGSIKGLIENQRARLEEW